MLYLSHLLPPTSTRHALKCDFIKPGIDSLILGKHSRIEVYELEPDGPKFIYSFLVANTIEHLNFYKKSNDSTATLLVLTSELQLLTIKFCPSLKAITITASISLRRSGARPADHLQTSIVDPNGRCVAIHALNGILHVIPLVELAPRLLRNQSSRTKRQKPNQPQANLSSEPKNSPSTTPSPTPPALAQDLDQIFQLPLNELHVHSITFAALPVTYHPILLILYSDHLGDLVLKYRKIDLQKRLINQGYSRNYTCRDPLTRLVIPICTTDLQGNLSTQNSGAILIGEEFAELVCFGSPHSLDKVNEKTIVIKHNKPQINQVLASRTHTRIPFGVYTCFCKIDELSDRWILGDLHGNLITLNLERSSNGPTLSLKYSYIGHVPSPEALVYIPRGYLFLASHYGDSQLLKLSSQFFSSDLDTTSLIPPEVVVSFTNLAPISDFCITEDRTSGAKQIVTCSGAYRDCSLGIVKSGIPFTESLSIEIPGVQRVWTFKKSSSSKSVEDFDDCILLSCVHCTRLLALHSDGTIEELEKFNGFRADTPTILAGNLNDCCIPNHRYPIQVTPNEVFAGEALRWTQEDGEIITGAAIGVSICVISLKRQILLLSIKNGSMIQEGKLHFQNDISNVAIDPHEKLIAVAQWISNTIDIISIPLLVKVSDLDFIHLRMINSMILTKDEREEHQDYLLLISMSNSEVMIVSLTSHGRYIQTHLMELGSTSPIQLIPMSVRRGSGTRTAIWANSDHPTLLNQSRNNERLFECQPIIIQDGPSLSASGLDTPNFPNSAILVLKNEIRISKSEIIANHKLMGEGLNIVKVPLGVEQPRRIAHSPALKAYGVLCVRSETSEANLQTVGSVKFFDDETFQLLYEYPLRPFEQGLSISVLKLGDAAVETFVIGTGRMRPHQIEPSAGMILGIGETLQESLSSSSRRIDQSILSHQLAGSVGGLDALPNGMFAASGSGYVSAYGIKQGVCGMYRSMFQFLHSWGHGLVAPTVVTNGTKVLVSDDCKSIVLLEFDLDELKFFVRAKDFRSMSIRKIGIIADDEYIASDNEGNMFTVKERRNVRQAFLTGSNNNCDDNDDNNNNDDDDDDDDDDDEVESSDIYGKHWLDPDRFGVKVDDKLDISPINDSGLCHSGAFHLGQNVNQFRAGSLIPKCKESKNFNPKLLFVTNTGGIGCIMHIKGPEMFVERVLHSQSVLDQYLKSLGCCYETSKTLIKSKSLSLEPTGFIDADRLRWCLDQVNRTKTVKKTSAGPILSDNTSGPLTALDNPGSTSNNSSLRQSYSFLQNLHRFGLTLRTERRNHVQRG